MIGTISGVTKHKDVTHLIVDVSGVGYKVFVTTDIALGTKVGDKVSLWTHLAVRENALDLFGFPEEEALEVFEHLITISGIGPKTALGIMNVATPAMLRQAVSEGDTSYLTKISGIGKKTADKIVRELEGKLAVKGEKSSKLQAQGDVLEALVSLGYSERDARNALKEIPNDIEDTAERVKHALKSLSTKS